MLFIKYMIWYLHMLSFYLQDLISRFVSLIPCISDTVDGNDDVDIWVTSEVIIV